jgi:4-hydroxy-tetrahydrodipicolinate reductase
MKIAIIGYGKMGKLLEIKAKERKHTISKILNNQKWTSQDLTDSDMAIDFSSPDSAVDNIHKAFQANVPIVVGTTGWNKDFDKVKNWCNEYNGAILPSSNFSLGVNIFFEINKQLSKIMNRQKSYSAKISETHHTKKVDSPSGTAITTAEIILEEMDYYSNWVSNSSNYGNNLPIIAKRQAGVAGTHEVIYESNIDELSISHRAKNRDGFAIGAIIAAEFLKNKKGLFSMKDVVKF